MTNPANREVSLLRAQVICLTTDSLTGSLDVQNGNGGKFSNQEILNLFFLLLRKITQGSDEGFWAAATSVASARRSSAESWSNGLVAS